MEFAIRSRKIENELYISLDDTIEMIREYNRRYPSFTVHVLTEALIKGEFEKVE